MTPTGRSSILARRLGIRMFSADPDPDSFDSLDKLCDEYKIAIGIHPHGPQGKTLHRWYCADAILKAVKNHNTIIGSCLDTGHLIRAAQLGKTTGPGRGDPQDGARGISASILKIMTTKRIPTWSSAKVY